MYGERRSGSGALNGIKWSSMILLIFGLMVFIFSIVLFSIEFNTNKAVSLVAFFPGFVLSFMAIGAGAAGSSVGKYEGQIHNLSAKNVSLPLNVGTLFAAITYMAITGTHYFYNVDKVLPLSSAAATSSYKASFGIFVAIFVFAFFCLILSAVLTVITAYWIPRENGGPSPYSSERNMIVHEEKMGYDNRVMAPHSGRRYHQSSYPSHRY